MASIGRPGKRAKDGVDRLDGRDDPDLRRSVPGARPRRPGGVQGAKARDREDVVRKHIKKVGAVTVDYAFARACASAIDTRGQLAGKAT